jgi:pantoate kinase
MNEPGPTGPGFGWSAGKALALVVAMALVATRATKAAADNFDFIDI